MKFSAMSAKKQIAVCLVAIIVVVGAVVGINIATRNHRIYTRAVRLLEAGDYHGAWEEIRHIRNMQYYRNANTILQFTWGHRDLDFGDYIRAFERFNGIPIGFRNTREMLETTKPLAYYATINIYAPILNRANATNAIDNYVIDNNSHLFSIGSDIVGLRRAISTFSLMNGFRDSANRAQILTSLIPYMEAMQAEVNLLVAELRETERLEREAEVAEAERQRIAQESIEIAQRYIVGTWEFLGDPQLEFQCPITGITIRPTTALGSPVSFFANGVVEIGILQVLGRYSFEDSHLVVRIGDHTEVMLYVTVESSDEITFRQVDDVGWHGNPISFLSRTYTRQ